MARVVGNDWKPADGVVDLIGEDGSRLTLAVQALPTLAAHARRVMNAHQNLAPAIAGHRFVRPLPVETLRVETMPHETGPRIVLMLDPDTDVETLLSLPAAHVRELADALLRAADQVEGQSLTRQ